MKKIFCFLVIFMGCFVLNAQEKNDLEVSLNNTRISNQGLWNVYLYTFNNLDYKFPDVNYRNNGPYISLGLELHEISFDGGTREKYNFELLGEVIYQIGSWARRGEVGNDEDDRYANPSKFTTLFVDFMSTTNFYVGKKIAFGGGLAINDLMITYNKALFPNEEMQQLPTVDYGLFLGPAVHLDFLITKSITLHTDVYRSFGMLFYENERYQKYNQPMRPYGFWRSSVLLIHHSGFFIGAKYSHLINHTSYDISPARFHFSLGYRQKMYKYNGETYRDDPRRNIKKTTF